eukprot:8184355-Karenia_brevis.AAC.1
MKQECKLRNLIVGDAAACLKEAQRSSRVYLNERLVGKPGVSGLEIKTKHMARSRLVLRSEKSTH